MVPTVEITLRRLGVRHVDLHLQVDVEHEAFRRLRVICLQALVEIVRRRALGPVQGQDEGRHDLGRVAARVDRVFAGAQRLLPDAAMARAHERAELEIDARGIFGGKTDIGLDHRHLALIDDEHRHHLDRHQERIEVVGAVEQRIVLQADPAAAIEECLEILVVVVDVVLDR